MKLSGWGRFPIIDCRLEQPRTVEQLQDLVRAGGPVIARGNGRSYGDSAVNEDGTISMTHFDRMLHFDPDKGELTVEAGVLLADVISAFLPRGWFPPVTPGTRFVTIGGMIAADVHGKNHHKHGTFGRFVRWIDLIGADGAIRRCSPAEGAELFDLTIGGMGLTGIILRAAFQLIRVETGWIRQKTIGASCLTDAMDIFDREPDWTYSVAWIDCLAQGSRLGRSLVFLGEHALLGELDEKTRTAPFRTPAKRASRIPLDLPSWALNRYSVRLFNSVYHANAGRKADTRMVDWQNYFYPLDSIREWNRIYGRKGLVQFQCVLPLKTAEAGLAALLNAIASVGQGSFLAVLKKMGPERGSISFPLEGYTLALDFPANPTSLGLLEKLDAITIEHGGRFYLAKDARMSPDTLERSDNRISHFRARRQESGLDKQFGSHQSRRLSI